MILHKNKKLHIALLLLLFGLIPFFAANAYTFEVSWPSSPTGIILDETTNLDGLISYLYSWSISLGGILVFIVLLFSGFKYMTSAGNPSAIKEAKNRMTSAIVGLILLLSSYIILITINPQLVKIIDYNDYWDSFYFGSNISDNNVNSPCDFVILWKGKDYFGDEKIFRFDDFQTRLQIRDGYLSGRSFVKITEEDLSQGLGLERYNEKGHPDVNGEYKEGGACSVDLLYGKSDGGILGTGLWENVNVCGERSGRSVLPSADFTLSLYRTNPVTCIEIVREIPIYTVTYSGNKGVCSPPITKVFPTQTSSAPTCYRDGWAIDEFERVSGEDDTGTLNSKTGEVKNVSGDQIIQVNWKEWGCGDDLIDIRDLQTYPTTQIGNYCWTIKNANYNEGGNHYKCYGNNTSNCSKYGTLYKQYQAVKSACPSGWSIALESNYNEVTKNGVSWSSNKWNPQYGGGGSHNFLGFSFWNLNNFGIYWTSTRTNVKNASARKIYPNGTSDTTTGGNERLHSVRCVKYNPISQRICDPESSYCRSGHGAYDIW